MKRKNFLQALCVLPVAGLLAKKSTPAPEPDFVALARKEEAEFAARQTAVLAAARRAPKGSLREYGLGHSDPMVRKLTASLYDTGSVWKDVPVKR